WATLAGMYGNRLTRDFGDSVPEPWRNGISYMPDWQIQRGLRRLSLAGSASVPTLPVFVKACRQQGDDEGQSRPDASALPPPTYDGFHAFGQRCLFVFLRRSDAIGQERLQALIRAKNKLANDFRELSRDEE